MCPSGSTTCASMPQTNTITPPSRAAINRRMAVSSPQSGPSLRRRGRQLKPRGRCGMFPPAATATHATENDDGQGPEPEEDREEETREDAEGKARRQGRQEVFEGLIAGVFAATPTCRGP